MPLETTVICLDNSEFMRNSDFSPTRIDSQKECATYIMNTRLHNHPDSSVGMLSMAGNAPELLVSPAQDRLKCQVALAQLKLGSTVNFIVSLQICMLALTHRKNKNGGQRIIVFVGSPLKVDPQKLVQISGQLKKNQIGVDVIVMGEAEANTDLLTEFVNAVSTGDNSSISILRGGNNIARDEISANVAFSLRQTGGGGGGGGGGGAAGAPAGNGGGANDFVDEQTDPEMAMIMRISLEEARRQAETAAETAMAASAPSGGATAGAGAGAAGAGFEDGGMDDMDEDLRMALQLSMQGESGAAGAAPTAATANAANAEQMQDGGEDDDDDMAAALALSMQGAGAAGTMPPQAPSAAETGMGGAAGAVDQDFIRAMLGELGGDGQLDPNDPLIAAALAQLTAVEEEGDKDGKDSKKRKDKDGKDK